MPRSSRPSAPSEQPAPARADAAAVTPDADVDTAPAAGRRRLGLWSLVTGATAGIGAEFARQLASQGYDLVLVARSADLLAAKAAALRGQYGAQVETITADLTTQDGLDAVADRLNRTTDPVHLLVNNAGSGLSTDFHESALQEELQMLRLLVEAPLQLSHAAINAFLRRGGGRIINVSSVAGLLPDGSYGAAKSWSVSFSRWANLRYQREGVTVTALCPGPVRTEFHQRAGLKTTGRPAWAWMAVDEVVREGLTAAAQGQAVCVPSRRFRSLLRAARFSPDAVLERLSRNVPRAPRPEASSPSHRSRGTQPAVKES